MTTTKRNVGFQGKDQYLQYRATWKQDYAALSNTIRDLKFCRRYDCARSKLNADGLERFARVEKVHGSSWGFCPAALALSFRTKATAMIDELKTSKIEAQRQYLEARKLLDVTPLNA